MPVFETLALVVLGLLSWLWFDSIKVRGIGVRAAKAACDAEGWQLLDDTVAIAGLGLARDDDGRLLLRRVYSFEYSDTGDNRSSGQLVMLGQAVLVISIGSRSNDDRDGAGQPPTGD